MTVIDQRISDLPSASLPLTGLELMEVALSGGNFKTLVGGARGPSIGKTMSSAYTASIANPTAMTFLLQRLHRPGFVPIEPNLQTFLDGMVQDFGYYQWTGNIGTRTYSNGKLNIASTSDAFGNQQNGVSYESLGFPCVGISLEGLTPTTDSGVGVLGVGLQNGTTGTNQIYCYMEQGAGSNNRVNIAQTVSGTFTVIASTANSSLPSGITGIAFTLEGTTAIAWLQVNGGSWFPVLQATSPHDLQVPATLLSLHPFFTVTGGISTPWKIGTVRMGRTSASVPFRDFKIVTNIDGSPYISNGYMYFTATNAFCSVWRLNVKSGRFEKTGVLAFSRNSEFLADLNAHIVWDAGNNVWRITWATWANGLGANIKIFMAAYDGDILNGSHIVAGGTQVNVTQQTGNAVYDQHLVWDAVNVRWLLSYIVSPSGAFGGNMHVAMDTSTDLVTWTSVWYDTTDSGYEGSCIAKIGGNFYVFAGNGSNFRCWNMASAVSLGTMSVDIFPPSSGNPPPHFIVFPWMDADITEYYALSWSNVQTAFNGGGTFSTGTPILYRATQSETGFQFVAQGVL